MGFQYEPWVYKAIDWCARGLFEPGISFKRATLAEDYGGVDLRYVVNHDVKIQVRCRFNRPAYSADSDVTFRSTEPAMMAVRTYAPLALFIWFKDQQIVAAKLVDIYRLYSQLDPAFDDRIAISNGDRTAFYSIAVEELMYAKALLRIFDGHVWATAILGGEQRLNRILRGAEPITSPISVTT